jgi:hypothetical protein
MKKRRYDRLAFAAAAALLLGVSSAALAQAPATASGQNTTSAAESKKMAEQKLAGYGLTNVQLKQLKNGWGGTATKDGKPVKVELTRSGEVRIK